MNILMYSKALYSSWLYYNADRLLFDAGEGASSVLGNKAFAIRRVFLSHGHADHIAGLVGLVNIRNNAMGDREKELTIYYPQGSFLVLEMIGFLERTNRRLSYNLEWVPLRAGDRVELLGGQLPRHIEVFPTVHVPSEPTLGYSIVETRHRLRQELAGASESRIAEIARERGRDAVTEHYEQRLFSYGGDSVAIKPELIQGTEILCHDSTFLDEQDRKAYKHATLAEAVATAREAGVQEKLLAYHISSRYRSKIKDVALDARFQGLDFEVVLVPPGRVFAVD
jgi:ribonuclease Z